MRNLLCSYHHTAQNIFSVKAESESGVTGIFKHEKDVLIVTDNGFDIHVYDKLYFYAYHVSSDKCYACHHLQTWHKILAYCNYGDFGKLQKVDGMKLKGKTSKPEQECEVRVQGKLTRTRNRNPDARAKAPLQLVYKDLAGSVSTSSSH